MDGLPLVIIYGKTLIYQAAFLSKLYFKPNIANSLHELVFGFSVRYDQYLAMEKNPHRVTFT
jgi:hypothetical protein